MAERVITDGLGLTTDMNFYGNPNEVLHPDYGLKQTQSEPEVVQGEGLGHMTDLNQQEN